MAHLNSPWFKVTGCPVIDTAREHRRTWARYRTDRQEQGFYAAVKLTSAPGMTNNSIFGAH
jgi:hypothetical protein